MVDFVTCGWGRRRRNRASFNRKNVEYFLGIIDFLQPYNAKKWLETLYKSAFHDKSGISAVDPDLYADRFLAFIETVIV